MTFYAIDFETANNYQNSACSVGVVRLVDGVEKDSVYSLIKPTKMCFRQDFTDIHGISYGDVRHSPEFPEVWQTVVEPFLKSSGEEKIHFVAHNAQFDMGVIRACCDYFGMPLPDADYACTLQIARKSWAEFDCHKLTYLAEKFGIIYKAHDALDDAGTCGKILTMAAEKSACSIDKLFSQYQKDL